MDDEDFGSFSMPEQYGQSYAPGSLMDNLGMPTTAPEMSTPPSDFDAYQYSLDNPGMPNTETYGQSFAPGSVGYNMVQTTPSWGMSTPSAEVPSNQGGITQTLADIFNDKKKMAGIGALFEGFQNLRKANAMQGLASKMQGAMDPFGGQRAGYQTQLNQAIQNPYSSPIVQAQIQQLQHAQAAKDAAAGRRSNSATSNPAMLAAQAQIAQNYINSLMTPAGANISPSGLSSLLQTQQQGINSGINGFVSPLLSAAGYASGGNNTAADLAAIKAKLGL